MKTKKAIQIKGIFISLKREIFFSILFLISAISIFSQPSLSSYQDGMAKPINKLKELKNYMPNIFKDNSLENTEENDEEDFLEIVGNFDGTVLDFNGKYTATLIVENDIIEVQDLKVRKSMFFLLQKNKIYTIRIDKEGYISKCISIYTFTPDDDRLKQPYLFTFETNLLSSDLISHFEDDDIDFPVALIGYKKDCKCFEYNKQYTSSLMNRMMGNLFFGM